MLLQELEDRKLIHPPQWLSNNTMYLCVMGSIAYGCDTDASDFDVYGFAVPPKDVVFPHLAGYIQGFGKEPKPFNQWTQTHILDVDALGGHGRDYDFSVYSIVRYFHLCMDNNPNMVDSLFVPQDCVLHATAVGGMVREKREIFLSKKAWHTFKGYAYSQLA
jgi:predicted nucleotidyltransferase